MHYHDFIGNMPHKRYGRPCPVETRIAFGEVLNCLVRGMSESAILADHPELAVGQVDASLAYIAERGQYHYQRYEA